MSTIYDKNKIKLSLIVVFVSWFSECCVTIWDAV